MQKKYIFPPFSFREFIDFRLKTHNNSVNFQDFQLNFFSLFSSVWWINNTKKLLHFKRIFCVHFVMLIQWASNLDWNKIQISRCWYPPMWQKIYDQQQRTNSASTCWMLGKLRNQFSFSFCSEREENVKNTQTIFQRFFLFQSTEKHSCDIMVLLMNYFL